MAQDRSGGDNADTQAVSRRTATGPAAPAPERRAPGASAYGPGVSRTVTETTPETRRHGHPVTPAATNIDARRSPAGHESRTSAEERYFIASQRQLMWRKFKKHRLAVISGFVLILGYAASCWSCASTTT